MSVENDVPLGEAGRRYYEQRFGARVRQVRKGGGLGWGRAGCATLIVLLLGFRLIAVLLNPGPSHHSIQYLSHSTPSQEPLRIEDLLPNRQDALAGAIDEDAALLRKEDVPLLQGLCYRIEQESRQPKPTPGKHLVKLLDPVLRDLISRSAKGVELDGIEEALILIALNEALGHPDFWDEAVFGNVPGMKEFLRAWNGIDDMGIDQPLHHLAAPLDQLAARRRILELCYPKQIIPRDQREKLIATQRASWRQRAKEDLQAARKQYESVKP